MLYHVTANATGHAFYTLSDAEECVKLLKRSPGVVTLTIKFGNKILYSWEHPDYPKIRQQQQLAAAHFQSSSDLDEI